MIILFLHLDLEIFTLGLRFSSFDLFVYLIHFVDFLCLCLCLIIYVLCFRDTGIFPFYPDKSPVGFREILERYQQITPGIQMSGPTNFAPLINKAIEIVKETKAVCFLFIYLYFIHRSISIHFAFSLSLYIWWYLFFNLHLTSVSYSCYHHGWTGY